MLSEFFMELDYISLKPVKPALTGYIREARILIKTATSPDEKIVHDVRVLMKKARAVLKLIAPQMVNGFVEREITALREVGREMSSWRETSVLRKHLKSFKKIYPDLFIKLQEIDKIVSLAKKPETDDLSADVSSKLAQILSILDKSSYRIRFEPMDNLDPNSLIKELENSYTVVIDNYLKTRNKPISDNIHEFRKRSKDFLYQLWFFKHLNASSIKELEKKLDNMTQNLGKHNDLSQLIAALDYKYEYLANPPELDEFIIHIREDQERYLSKVWPVAYKYFCPGSKLINVLGFKLLIIK
jgi:CHAD domain-containing protein